MRYLALVVFVLLILATVSCDDPKSQDLERCRARDAYPVFSWAGYMQDCKRFPVELEP